MSPRVAIDMDQEFAPSRRHAVRACFRSAKHLLGVFDEAMTNQDAPRNTGSSTHLAEAFARLAPRSRQVMTMGVTLIVIGSAAMAVIGMSSVASLTPIGLLMAFAALLELGLGHNAKGGEPGAVPWDISGSLLAIAAALTAASPLLPPVVVSVGVGLALMGAGWMRLRSTSLVALRRKSAIVPVASSVTILIGILILTRWPGENIVVTGNLLALDLIATGWGFVGLGLTLRRALET